MSCAVFRADLDLIVDLIPRQARVLDLGCGDGELLVMLAQRKAVIGRGVELSETGVRRCVARGLSVRQGNIDEGLGDYPTHSFDYVVLSQTLPYVDDLKVTLCETLRVGTRAIVSFPNLGHWRNRLALLLKGRLPPTAFSACAWNQSPRERSVSIADFVSFCAAEEIDIVQRLLLSDKGPLAGFRAKSLWAATGLFVLSLQDRK